MVSLSSFEPLEIDQNHSSETKLALKINHERLAVMRDEYVINREKLTSRKEERQIREILVADIEMVQLLTETRLVETKFNTRFLCHPGHLKKVIFS